MRGFEEDELVEAIKELVDYEREFEDIKQRLASNPDFNIDDAFNLFDFSGSGVISVTDIQEAYNLYGVYPTLDEAELILNRYDNDGDSRLVFAEFMELFNP